MTVSREIRVVFTVGLQQKWTLQYFELAEMLFHSTVTVQSIDDSSQNDKSMSCPEYFTTHASTRVVHRNLFP